jgi:NAD kinase
MAGGQAPRVVVVTRSTEYEQLIRHHATAGQARFFLRQRSVGTTEIERGHGQLSGSLLAVEQAIPTSWRRSYVQRSELDRFLFEPEDIIFAVGQDGLVANVSKYLHGQPVIGVNPDPNRNPGVLVRHRPAAAADLLTRVMEGRAQIEARSMVEARLDDGQSLQALNEVFVGHHSHQSARYRLSWQGQEERQSSSGLIVTTGSGATGWASSISRERGSQIQLPAPSEDRLAFFVREAWPSPATGTELTEGLIQAGESLEVISEMDEGGVVFGDGIEADSLRLVWGERVQVSLAESTMQLVVG